MNAPEALGAGLLAGIAIAVQFGAVSALLVETAVGGGPRTGAAAGLGIASVDTAYAAGAVAAGGVARSALAGHRVELNAAAAVILALVGAHGLWGLTRGASGVQRVGTPTAGDGAWSSDSSSAPYVRFVALTAINPLTVVYFASVAASLSLVGFAARAAFVAGVGAASALWHLLLSLTAGHAGQRLTPQLRRGISIAGRLAVVALAIRLAIVV
jgi:threonine/homoserine/homoserine lactone efflux protein